MKFALQSLIIIFVLAITAIPVHADGMHPRGIQLDGTLGNAGKLDLPGPDYDIKAEYGQQAGTNLFHSFHRFNIHSDETATFSGPSSVQNIISRVTGGDPSWIDGELRSDIAGADLYLLNPAGVMFGPGASLDLGGSFHVSTADYLRLGENERFYTTPHADDVLSADAPVAFGFLDGHVGQITYEGRGEITEQESEDNPAGIRVKEGRSISLIGGDIEITRGAYYETYETDEGGNLIYEQETDELGDPAYEIETDADGELIYDEDGRPLYKLDETGEYIPIYVYDEDGNPIPVMKTEHPGDVASLGGRINIASVASEGEVIPTESDLKVTSSEKGDITIRDMASADVSGIRGGGGSIFIRGGRFELADSRVTSYTWGDRDGGEIDIQADNSDVQNSIIATGTEGIGKSGDIVLKSADTLKVSKSSVYASSFGEEDCGNIEIEARQINLTDGASVSSDTYGFGQGGDIVIKAADTLILSGLNEEGEGTVISSDSEEYAEGNAGRIAINAGQITLTDGALVSSDTYGFGQGGAIVIKAEETLGLSEGSKIFATSQKEEVNINTGNAGHIEIEARRIMLKDKSQINVSTFGSGEGGTVTVRAADALTFSDGSEDGDPGGIFANSEFEEGDGGSAGDIRIDARQITITDWLEISSTTKGYGNGGAITVNVDDTLKISASDTSSVSPNCGIFAKSNGISAESGSGAGMDISARTILLSGKRAAISASTYGGDAGDIRLTSDQLKLDNGASVFSASYENSGDAGTITVNAADSIRMTGNSKLSTSTDGEGDAGDISLTADRLELDNGASVFSESLYDENGGEAGTITVKAADSVRLTGNSKLTTEARGAGGGIISVNAGNEIYLVNGRITSSVKQGKGKGGDVTTSSGFVILNHGNITANAEEGDGGAIFIRTENYIISSDSKVTASSERGNDGTVRIEAPDTDITGDLTPLPDSYPDAARWLKTPCAARSGENVSRFIIDKQEPMRDDLDDFLPARW
ncbi:filamentous hemagglutinin N-terminal domain-containing protein [Desulfococcaceae bacterium HSG8]|nr:filamentous hemagglutinin N-terminal domain-containing protein [Desulfococcaceae bacterium HSG8]